jgi:HlyD family secretion protein
MTPDRPAPRLPEPRGDAASGREGQLARDLEVLRGGARAGTGAHPPRRRRGLGLALVGVLALLVAGYAGLRAAWRPAEVSLVVVTRRDVGVPPVALSASGYLVAKRQITVSSRAQGKIVEMPVAENQRVAAGDLIARIESDEQRASLALAQAQYADAERELRRSRQLHAQGTLAQAALDAAETADRVARARLDLARVALANTVLRAPIDGTVIRKIRDEGEFLTLGVTAEGDPGTAVVTLADLSAVDVSLEIDETQIGKIRLGAPALVTPEALPDRNYVADVSEIAAMADRQKGVVPVKVRIRAPDRQLLPDMTAKVRFLEREPEGRIEVLPALPATAVVLRDGAPVVFVARDDAVQSVPVRTRPIGDGAVALLEGPDLGTYVVEVPPPGLASGDPIRVETP